MTEIREMRADDIEACVQIYRSAYAAEPWREEYTESEVEKYLSEFMAAGSARCFVQIEAGKIFGLALTLLIPGMGAPYLRIEDFCIDASCHRMGFGSRFMNELMLKARKLGCDSLLLGTQHGFPSHGFYLKNGFFKERNNIETINAMLEIKDIFKTSSIKIENAEKLEKVVDYLELNEEEQQLLNQLFSTP